MNQISEYSIQKPNQPVEFYQSCVEMARSRSASWSIASEAKLPFLTAFFLLANLLDIFMTWALLSTGSFREANPLANYVLDNWGFTGMIGFKLAFVSGIILIAQYVASKKLATARALLIAGTLMVAGVVAYSANLFLGFIQAM